MFLRLCLLLVCQLQSATRGHTIPEGMVQPKLEARAGLWVQLVGGGEANALVAVVEHGEELTDEHVAKDDQGASRGGDVDAGHAEQTDGVLVVDDVLAGGDRVGLAVDGDINVGQRRHLGAVHGELVGVQEEGGGAQCLGQGLGVSGGHGQQGGAGVNNGALGGGLRGTVHIDAVDLDLPVQLGAEVDVGDVTGVLVANSAQGQSSLLVVGVGQVEREHGLLPLLLGDEVGEDGGDAVHGDGVPSAAGNAVELAQGVRGAEAGHVGDLSEQGGHALAANGDDVLGQVAAHGAGSVHDLEHGAVGLVRGRLGGIVLGVAAAVGALGGRKPEGRDTMNRVSN